MFYKKLDTRDIIRYDEALFKAFNDNHLILDEQNELKFEYKEEFGRFLNKYVEAKDSLAIGIFDNNKCQGYVIFDNMRMTEETSCAQVHIAISKDLRGKKALKVCKDIRDNSGIDTFYCEIPSIAAHAINLCKRLGFKKTGYIPNNLPYTNVLGETKMYDTYIMVYRNDIDKEIKTRLSKILEEICL